MQTEAVETLADLPDALASPRSSISRVTNPSVATRPDALERLLERDHPDARRFLARA